MTSAQSYPFFVFFFPNSLNSSKVIIIYLLASLRWYVKMDERLKPYKSESNRTDWVGGVLKRERKRTLDSVVICVWCVGRGYSTTNRVSNRRESTHAWRGGGWIRRVLDNVSISMSPFVVDPLTHWPTNSTIHSILRSNHPFPTNPVRTSYVARVCTSATRCTALPLLCLHTPHSPCCICSVCAPGAAFIPNL